MVELEIAELEKNTLFKKVIELERECSKDIMQERGREDEAEKLARIIEDTSYSKRK